MSQYELKNRYLKNARVSESEFIFVLRAFLRGFKPSQAAKLISRSEPALRDLFKRIRFRLFHTPHYYINLIHRLEMDNQDAVVALISKILSVQPNQLHSCAFLCSTDTPPGHVRRYNNGQTSERNPLLMRLNCRTCPVGWVDYEAESATTKYSDWYKENFAEWVVQKSDMDVLKLWIETLYALSEYRALKDFELTYFSIIAAIQAAVRSRDLIAPAGCVAGMPVPISLINNVSGKSEGNYQNDLEGPVLYAALDVIKEDPL